MWSTGHMKIFLGRGLTVRNKVLYLSHADNSDEAAGGEMYWSETLAPVVSKIHAILAKYP